MSVCLSVCLSICLFVDLSVCLSVYLSYTNLLCFPVTDCISSLGTIPIQDVSSRQQLFEFDESLTKGDEDAYHFVGYVPIGGRLYELDGLKDGPIDHGKCSERDWLETCKPILDERIAR